MIWVDWAYYTKNYLLGSTPRILEKEFLFWSKQAQMKINWKKVEIDEPKDILKDCVCEVAEALFDKKDSATISQIVVGQLFNTEYHNDFVYAGEKIPLKLFGHFVFRQGVRIISSPILDTSPLTLSRKSPR